MILNSVAFDEDRQTQSIYLVHSILFSRFDKTRTTCYIDFGIYN